MLQKGGFNGDDYEAEISTDEDEYQEMNALWQQYNMDIHQQAYVSMDDDLKTFGTLSEDEIVKATTKEEKVQEIEDEPNEIEPIFDIPSTKHIKECFKSISYYLMSQKVDTSRLQSISLELEKECSELLYLNIKQSTIDKFFKNNTTN